MLEFSLRKTSYSQSRISNSQKNGKELQTVIGMMICLNGFSTKLTELSARLREVMKSRTYFRRDDRHQTALETMKKELCDEKFLSYYYPDPEIKTMLQCNANWV